MLPRLLYRDRKLIDGWDKVASIYRTSDWPFFERHRNRMRAKLGRSSNPPMKIADEVMQAIREEGPKSPIDFKRDESIKWTWGVNTSLPRACLEVLYAMGELVVYDRIGSRRVFELAERALPEDLLAVPDPNETVEAYQDWHVARRIAGLGLANPAAGDWWLGMNEVKAVQRREAIGRLVERGDLITAEVEGLTGRIFYVRAVDVSTLERVGRGRPPKPRAAFLGAMDNLMWDRNMVRWLFDFDYVWEVYKPETQRRYGYYVLPVIYGDRFIARLDPVFNRESSVLTINDWWWEDGIDVDDEMCSALASCLLDFLHYLEADQVVLGPKARRKRDLGWVQ